ncbi:hypothetical protein AB0K92_14850 [Streptomyces sp. NPDC052687]|uniref:hypothetical protein n=1 Tax=Streptomyces sp. NPDC052687 TaxID=3154759 RepID=UPI00343E8354
MSGRPDSDTPSEIARDPAAEPAERWPEDPAEGPAERWPEEPAAESPEAPAEGLSEARRARWTASGAGALLTLAGLSASALRATASAPALVPAAYGLGAAVCALAAVLGSRGRTRRALWLLVAGVMVMAVGDHFD